MTDANLMRLYNDMLKSDFLRNDLKCPVDPSPEILVFLFDINKNINWKSLDNKFCRIFRENATMFANMNMRDRHYSVYSILAMKSALVLMGKMVPDVADTLLYSHLMEGLDIEIDSWPRKELPLRDYVELCDVQLIYKMLPKHSWWRCDDLDTINGEPFLLSALVACKHFRIYRTEKTKIEEITRRKLTFQRFYTTAMIEFPQHRLENQSNLNRIHTIIDNSYTAVSCAFKKSVESRNVYHRALVVEESKRDKPGTSLTAMVDLDHVKQARKTANQAFEVSLNEFNALYTVHVCPLLESASI